MNLRITVTQVDIDTSLRTRRKASPIELAISRFTKPATTVQVNATDVCFRTGLRTVWRSLPKIAVNFIVVFEEFGTGFPFTFVLNVPTSILKGNNG